MVKVIDAQNAILGRLATYVAKQAILGEQIEIVNCEEAVISGSHEFVLGRYLKKMQRGQPFQGPIFQRSPEKLVRRTIRGMIPWQGPRGKEILGRIKCHIGKPSEIKEEAHKVKSADSEKLPNYRFVKVGVICHELGWKK